MNVAGHEKALLARVESMHAAWRHDIAGARLPDDVAAAAYDALQSWAEGEEERIRAGAEDFTRE